MRTIADDIGLTREAELENLLAQLLDAVDQNEAVYVYDVDATDGMPATFEWTQGFEDILERARVVLAREDAECE